MRRLRQRDDTAGRTGVDAAQARPVVAAPAQDARNQLPVELTQNGVPVRADDWECQFCRGITFASRGPEAPCWKCGTPQWSTRVGPTSTPGATSGLANGAPARGGGGRRVANGAPANGGGGSGALAPTRSGENAPEPSAPPGSELTFRVRVDDTRLQVVEGELAAVKHQLQWLQAQVEELVTRLDNCHT